MSLELTFPDEPGPAMLVAGDPLATRVNYFGSSDRHRWYSGVRTYGSVTWRWTYAAMSVTLRAVSGEPALVLRSARHGQPIGFRLRVDGARDLRALPDGQLVAGTVIGDVILPPVIGRNGAFRPLPRGTEVSFAETVASFGSSRLQKSNTVSTGNGLLYGTFLGGSNDDQVAHLVVGADGSKYLSGWTSSSDFPTTPGAFDTSYDNLDAFVSKLDPTGSSLIYSTFLGGSSSDYALSLAVGMDGAAYVGGYTASDDYPTTPGAFRSNWNGTTDGFITKLDPTGSSLLYSTYIGGSGSNVDDIQALALAGDGTVYATGDTLSADFPTTPGAFDTVINNGLTGAEDAFVTVLNPSGSDLVYSTFLGGTDNDYGHAIVLGPDGTVYVTGETRSVDYPTTVGSFDRSFNGGNSDVFVTHVDANGTALVYSTYIGGSDQDVGSAIAVSSTGTAYLTGYTSSSDYPTTPGAYDPTINSFILSDVFATALNPVGASLAYSTFLGGADYDAASGLALDPDGTLTVVGSTQSSNFPTTPGAYQPFLRGSEDAFVSRFDPTGSKLLYSTFLGGGNTEFGDAAAAQSPGVVSVAGRTFSGDFPTTPGAYDRIYNGRYDVFVASLQVAQLIHVASIDPRYRPDGPGYDVGARIRIVSSGGSPVSGAKVTVEVDYPDGSSVKATITTGPRGNAAVVRRVTDTGTYTFTVLDVMKPPAVYDALQNVETSDSVTIP